MSSKFVKANIPFNKVSKFFLRIYFSIKYNISYNNKDLQKINPPYIILANHVNNLDPFFITSYIKQPVYFVTSDEQFRYPLRKFLLRNLVGAIPKKKFVSDINTVKDIIKVIKNKGIVGIFPEGQRSWEGETKEIIFSTAKLVKKIGVPVVTVQLKGALLAHPRWSNTNRKGKVELDYTFILSSKQIKEMSIEEIQTCLQKSLYHNEYQYQQEKMNTYKAAKLAENLELFLFTCPKCHTIGSLKSENNKFFCENCGYSVTVNEYGFFDKVNNTLFFKNPGEWDKWQLTHLQGICKTAVSSEDNIDIISDNNVSLYVSTKFKPLEKLTYGNIILNKDNLAISDTSKEVKLFKLSEISGVSIQYKNELEFYYDEKLYRFKFDDITISAHKWSSAIEFLQVY